MRDGWPTSGYPATKRVPHISILRCGHRAKREPYTLKSTHAAEPQALRLAERPFWQTRYYDFNVLTHNKGVKDLDNS
jgi:hypothetical protein